MIISKFWDNFGVSVGLYVCLYKVRQYLNFGLSHACHNVCADMIIQEWIFFSEPDFRLYSWPTFTRESSAYVKILVPFLNSKVISFCVLVTVSFWGVIHKN